MRIAARGVGRTNGVFGGCSDLGIGIIQQRLERLQSIVGAITRERVDGAISSEVVGAGGNADELRREFVVTELLY